jgi:hypothetical protein
MITLLASTVPPEGFSTFLASLFYGVGLVTALLVLWKQLFPKPIPQPFMTKVEDQLVTKQECAVSHGHMHTRVLTLEARMDRVERKMETDKVEIITAGEERARQIHDRINTVLSAVSELKGEIKHLVHQ